MNRGAIENRNGGNWACSGFSVIRQAEQNLLALKELNPSDAVRDAVLLYPSLATSDKFFRRGTVLFCPFAVLVGLVADFYQEWGKLMAVKDIFVRSTVGWAVLFLMMLSIYGAVAKRVWHPFGWQAKP